MKPIIAIVMLCLSVFGLNLEKPKTYSNQEISGWFMSEKLDGIRAFWDGKNLLTKNGNIIYAPKYLTKNFPDFSLDGELWTKRNDFENIQNIVLDQKPSLQWSQITYNIFEVPSSKGDFGQRLERAKEWFKNNPNEKVNIIKQLKCKNSKHLENYLEEIVLLKGEGVIIKNPYLSYINKRSSNSLKVKKFYDTEGKVININYNSDSNMKSLVLKLENGIVFNLGNGFTKENRINYPKIGETVTFKYYGLTKYKKPKFASFLRVRKKE